MAISINLNPANAVATQTFLRSAESFGETPKGVAPSNAFLFPLARENSLRSSVEVSFRKANGRLKSAGVQPHMLSLYSFALKSGEQAFVEVPHAFWRATPTVEGSLERPAETLDLVEDYAAIAQWGRKHSLGEFPDIDIAAIKEDNLLIASFDWEDVVSQAQGLVDDQVFGTDADGDGNGIPYKLDALVIKKLDDGTLATVTNGAVALKGVKPAS